MVLEVRLLVVACEKYELEGGTGTGVGVPDMAFILIWVQVLSCVLELRTSVYVRYTLLWTERLCPPQSSCVEALIPR